MLHQLEIRSLTRLGAWLLAVAGLALSSAVSAQSGNPIKIGYGISQTGGLAPNGKSALLAQQIWEEDVNAKGGLLGCPVKLVYYDDQTNPATVPALYQKLLDVDKVDIVIGGYGTNLLAPAMPGPPRSSCRRPSRIAAAQWCRASDSARYLHDASLCNRR